MIKRICALIFLLFLSGFVYWPGVMGGFHLDDFPNLEVLSNVQAGASWEQQLAFSFSQFSGATRLLPQLTFVVQASSWPAQPTNFIVVNILLHLFNGALVFMLAYKLAALAGMRHSGRIGLLSAAIWLLSPIQVAGVLYVIQRINQMAALFVFAGALSYLHGRTLQMQSKGYPFAWMLFGVVGCGILAVLCKENGVLLPLLLLVAELTLLSSMPVNIVYRRLFLYLPLLVLAILLAWQMPNILLGYAKRDFGLVERVLTQPSILFDYIRHFILPRGSGLGLFHDDWPVAQWPPNGGALFSVVVLSILLSAAIYLRKRHPIFAFGVLWFFAGHVLESSFIPLELYFEHRNYLPLFGPAFALSAAFFGIYERISSALRFAVGLLAFGWLGVAVGVTYNQSSLWGNPAALYEVWQNDHPASPRANSAIAGVLAQRGYSDAARLRLQALVSGVPPRPEYYLQWLKLSCDGHLGPPPFQDVLVGLAKAKYSTAPVNDLKAIADRMHDGTCPALGPLVLLDLVRVLEANPAYTSSQIRLKPLAGRFLELGGRYEAAVDEIGAAYRLTGNPELGFIQLRLLNKLGRAADVEKELDALERHIRNGGGRYARYLNDVETWRKYLANAS